MLALFYLNVNGKLFAIETWQEYVFVGVVVIEITGIILFIRHRHNRKHPKYMADTPFPKFTGLPKSSTEEPSGAEVR